MTEPSTCDTVMKPVHSAFLLIAGACLVIDVPGNLQTLWTCPMDLDCVEPECIQTPETHLSPRTEHSIPQASFVLPLG